MNAELNAMRRSVADDNEEFVVKGVKGVGSAQELMSKSRRHSIELVICLSQLMHIHCQP